MSRLKKAIIAVSVILACLILVFLIIGTVLLLSLPHEKKRSIGEAITAAEDLGVTEVCAVISAEAEGPGAPKPANSSHGAVFFVVGQKGGAEAMAVIPISPKDEAYLSAWPYRHTFSEYVTAMNEVSREEITEELLSLAINGEFKLFSAEPAERYEGRALDVPLLLRFNRNNLTLTAYEADGEILVHVDDAFLNSK